MWLIKIILFQRLTQVFRLCVVGTASANSSDLPTPEFFISVSGDEFVFMSLQCLVFNLEIP